MRVVAQYDIDVNISSCDVGTWSPTFTQPWYGATEDYSIIINGTATYGGWLVEFFSPH